MKCPKCNVSAKVTLTREEDNIRYRVYKCPDCGFRFGTKEERWSFRNARTKCQKIFRSLYREEGIGDGN